MPARSLRRRLATLLSVGLVLTLRDTTVCAAEANYRFDAVQAFEEGRYEDALESLSRGPQEADLALLAAHCLARLGKHEAALARLPEPGENWPDAVREDLAPLRMQWAAEAGLCAQLKADDPAVAERSLARFRARCAFRAQDFAQVKELLAKAKDSDGRGMYIRALYALHDNEEANALGREFYIERPANHHADRIHQLLKQAAADFELTIEEKLRRAEAWTSARRPEVALQELAKLRKQRDKKLEARRLHVTGKALFRMRTRYPEAARIFARAAKLKGDTEVYDAFHAIRATARADKNLPAIRRFKLFAKEYPRSDYAPDAVYLAAWLSSREKLRAARKDLAKFAGSRLAARRPSLRRKAEWDLGWLAVKRRDVPEAKKWLARYVKSANSSLERARATYWLGRVAMIAREPALAKQHLREVLDMEPLSYYALLSVDALKQLGEAAPPAFSEERAFPEPKVDLPPEVLFYRDLGLRDSAARATQKVLPGLGDQERLEALRVSGDATSMYRAAARLGRDLLTSDPKANAWLWEALLPRPYHALVLEQTAKNGLSEHLFYGHMQVESRYDPSAVSGADALGLMQLIPPTAKRVGREIDLKVTRRDVLRPYINIALGARYLGGLLKRYRGQTPLAIAAYNAGEDRVDQWLRKTGKLELTRWVEEIPITQTRNYVRRVITAWMRYHAFSAPDAPWDIELPHYVRLGTK